MNAKADPLGEVLQNSGLSQKSGIPKVFQTYSKRMFYVCQIEVAWWRTAGRTRPACQRGQLQDFCDDGWSGFGCVCDP